MTTTPKSSKPSAPAAEVEEPIVAAPTFKATANALIDHAAQQLGIEAKDRYKVQRAFGYIAMQLAIEDGTLENLIRAVVSGAGDLPAGFGLEAPAKKEAAR